MVVFFCFGSYILQSNPINFKTKISSNALMKLRLENLRKLRTAIINRPMRLQLIICRKKRAPFFAFFYKARTNTQQVLPVPTGLYHYDK